MAINNPTAAARTGNNSIDNIEQIKIKNPIRKNSYQLNITHKNNLQNGYQDFSLIITGATSIDFPQQVPVEDKLTIYPVPADNQVHIFLDSKQQGTFVGTLINMLGIRLFQFASPIISGFNTFTIDTQNYPTGTYIVDMQAGVLKTVKKILIIH